ncbi:MAG: GNAT family N-acetyltransferase [Anaerolineales bacterium]
MIYGTNIRLRAIERDDLPRFVAWFNDPEVREGLELGLPMSIADEEQWYERMLQNDRAAHPLAIDVRDGERWQHVGSCGFMNIKKVAHNAELGIVIGDKAYWDKGYGTEVMHTLLRHGFGTLNLHRIYLRVFDNNPRAIKVYLRAGFTEEGRLREDRYHDGRYNDTIVMGILHAEWAATQQEIGE